MLCTNIKTNHFFTPFFGTFIASTVYEKNYLSISGGDGTFFGEVAIG
jgi:hypothetical protein